MRGLLLAILSLAFTASTVMAQGALPVISAPADGQALRGQVSITGTTDIPGFVSAELDFAYASDATGNWFPIQTFSQPATNSTLAAWDTTSISDGNYILRLRVVLQDGTLHDATIRIQVRNEAPPATAVSTATSTPAFVPQLSTSLPAATTSATPTTPPFSTPTFLPSNPAEVQTDEVYRGIERGALIIVGLFIFLGILIRLRRS